ncbi:MAG: hypothetical protein V1866_02385 [archaeon]
MSRILKKDEGVLVTLEDGLVRKTVIGRNHSGFRNSVSPEEMVDREIRALQMLRGVEGIQRFVRRESADTFYSEHMEGDSLFSYRGNLGRPYFDELTSIISQCQENNVYRIGQNMKDFLIMPSRKPGIVDFGNILFSDDSYIFSGMMAISKIYSSLRLWDLRRICTDPDRVVIES